MLKGYEWKESTFEEVIEFSRTRKIVSGYPKVGSLKPDQDAQVIYFEGLTAVACLSQFEAHMKYFGGLDAGDGEHLLVKTPLPVKWWIGKLDLEKGNK